MLYTFQLSAHAGSLKRPKTSATWNWKSFIHRNPVASIQQVHNYIYCKIAKSIQLSVSSNLATRLANNTPGLLEGKTKNYLDIVSRIIKIDFVVGEHLFSFAVVCPFWGCEVSVALYTVSQQLRWRVPTCRCAWYAIDAPVMLICLWTSFSRHKMVGQRQRKKTHALTKA